MAEVKNEKLVTRSKKVAYMKVEEQYHRMTKFTDMTNSKNPKEYSRKYIEEVSDTTDVVGYAPSIAYAFDYYENNVVQNEIIEISDKELIGDDAIREIVVVDFTKPVEMQEGQYHAISRMYSVVPDGDGGDADTYTYTGNFKSKSAPRNVKVSTADDWKTLTIAE